MLLALRSLWEKASSARGILFGGKKRVRNWNEIVSPMSMDVEVVVEGVAAWPRIGNPA
jgi:hypothetical protein